MTSLHLSEEGVDNNLTETPSALRAKQGGNYDCRQRHRIYRSNMIMCGDYDPFALCLFCGTSLHWNNDPTEKEKSRAMDERLERIRQFELEFARMPKKQSHAGHELGPREFTLTYSPKWFDDTTAREKMITAIQKLMKYYKDEIINFVAVGETGSKDGLSHIHAMYELRGGLKITDKNFKRAYPYWNPKIKLSYRGFQGGHHEVVKNAPDFQGYIDKQKNPWYVINANDNQKAHD